MSTKVALSSDLPKLTPREIVLLSLIIEHNFDNKAVLTDSKCPYVDGGGYYSAKRKVQPYIDLHIQHAQTEAINILRNGAPKAAKNFVEKVDHRDAKVSMEASGQILDRIGVSGKSETPTNIQVNINNALSDDASKYAV